MQILLDIIERRFNATGVPEQVFSNKEIQKEFLRQLKNGSDGDAMRFVCNLIGECLAAGVKHNMPLEAGIVEHIANPKTFNADKLIELHLAGKIKRHATLIETVMERIGFDKCWQDMQNIAKALVINPDSPTLADDIINQINAMHEDAE